MPASFNPRVREGRDFDRFEDTRVGAVSIHASVKDATDLVLPGDIHVHVSIHASVKDATFNRCCFAVHIDVSIHASVKDATSGA